MPPVISHQQALRLLNRLNSDDPDTMETVEALRAYVRSQELGPDYDTATDREVSLRAASRAVQAISVADSAHERIRILDQRAMQRITEQDALIAALNDQVDTLMGALAEILPKIDKLEPLLAMMSGDQSAT